MADARILSAEQSLLVQGEGNSMDVSFNGSLESLQKKTKAKKQFSTDRMMWMILLVLEALLGARFLLALGKIDMGSGFLLVFGRVSEVVIAPYNALLSMPHLQGSGLEAKTLVAMGVYAAMFWIVISMSASQATQTETSIRGSIGRIEV